jgi:hypothetical protein
VARCVDVHLDTAPDDRGQQRRIYRFRLRFDSPPSSNRGAPARARTRRPIAAPPSYPGAVRRPRPFDERAAPARYRFRGARTSPEETAALQEKATQSHHLLLAGLSNLLKASGWTEVEEIPAALDLWARPAETDLGRVIFEAKSAGSELHRVRAGLAQLLEYRFLHGEPSDALCLVTTERVRDERIRFLRGLGIDVIWANRSGFTSRGESVNPSVEAFLSGARGSG